MYTVYILKSLAQKRFYIGHTENISNRLSQHNKGKVKSTKGYIPWKIVHTENFITRSDAYRREQQIKKFKSGILFKKLTESSRDAGAVNRGRL